MAKQINISISDEWYDHLMRTARELSVEQDRTISHIDLVKDAVKHAYGTASASKLPQKATSRK